MRIEYRLTFGDYLLFQATHQFRSGALQVMYLLLSGFVYLATVKELGTLGAVIEAAIVYLLMWALQLGFNVIYMYSSKNKSVLTEHVVELQDDAFYEETAFNRSFHYWPGVVKIVRGPRIVAVYVTAHVAHVIPRRAFASEEQVCKFVAAARERIQASQPSGQRW